ncbi:uncharacterized protein Tco025E_05526 [Trypanosoma conorhini]|uniref:NTF2 domain-containing protein n=1 Tax=Trypanosoma conorhini TaxID=83891 RepID=A0A422PCK7_9TRYP|nr:uncharacterized protein Tco025E_05526 [Trypanosoma conorhini]RNF15423.1 hypothetical protein Tco025E_05526 [Trypanosoma conorhini]
MLSRETVAGVACSFLVSYYRELVKEKEIVGLVELYGESSLITYAGYNEETTVVAQGRHEIAQHLGKMDDALGRRKVEVRFADYAPLPGGCIHIVCQGIMYLRGQRRAFFQAFVLAPTQYRTNTYHIAMDYFRFMMVEVEHIPEDSIVMTPAQVAQHLLEEHERRKRAEETREQLRRQQAAAEQLRLKQAEEAARQKELQQARAEREPRRERANINVSNYAAAAAAGGSEYVSGGNNRRDRPERSDERRGERSDARRLNRNEGGGSKNNRPERAERSSGRNDERGKQNGDRRWERHDGGRGERRENVRPREEKGAAEEAAAPRSAPTSRLREQPNAAAAKPESGEKPNLSMPVPRSRAALERRGDSKAEGADGGSHNNGSRRETAAPRRGPAAAEAKRTKPADAAEAAAAVEAKEPARARLHPGRTGSTEYARLVRVPKSLKLTDIKEAVAAVLGAEPLDAYWHGRTSADCVLQLRSSAAVEQLVRDSMTVLETTMTVAKFYP